MKGKKKVPNNLIHRFKGHFKSVILATVRNFLKIINDQNYKTVVLCVVSLLYSNLETIEPR